MCTFEMAWGLFVAMISSIFPFSWVGSFMIWCILNLKKQSVINIPDSEVDVSESHSISG